MRRPLFPAILLATTLMTLVFAFAGPALSQQPQQQPQANQAANVERFGMAVVDISYIFKNYRKFAAEMDGLKQQLDQIESMLTAERDKINREIEKLGQFKVGEPEYKTQDELVAKMKAEFNLMAQKHRKEIMEQESQAYYQAYLEVSSVVGYYAQQRKIGLVVRFNGEAVDRNKREDILRAINKPVVFQNGLDITADILAMLNRGAPGQVRQTADQRPRAVPQFPQPQRQ